MKNTYKLTGMLLAAQFFVLVIFLGCASTEPAQKPSSKVPQNNQNLDKISPRAVAQGVLDKLDPRQKTYQEAAEAAKAFKQQVEKIDIESVNDGLAHLDELLLSLHSKANELNTTSFNRAMDNFQQASEKLAVGMKSLNEKIVALRTDQLNPALQSSEQTFNKIGQAADELIALLGETRELINSINPQHISETIEHIEVSSRQLRLASTKLPSTTSSLSTTIWLLNALLAVGITLGVIQIIRLRKQRSS